MRILFVGELNPVSRSYQRFRALGELGHEMIGCSLAPTEQGLDYRPSVWQRMRWKLGIPTDIYRVNARFISDLEANVPDLVWIEKGNVIWPRTLARIKKLLPRSIVVSYSEDDMFARHNRSWYYTAGLKSYDFVITTKSYNCNANELPTLGARCVIFVDKAFDIHAHRPIDITDVDVKQYGGDVGFIGTYERSRAESMLFLAKNGIRVRVWGADWGRFLGGHPNLIVENRGLYGDDYCKGICATKINLCYLRKANRDLQTDRTMEIPACGAFMLAERTDEHQRLFEEGVEAAYFKSNQELLEKVRFYLANEGGRRVVARAARRRCEVSGYSHHDRLRWILNQLNAC